MVGDHDVYLAAVRVHKSIGMLFAFDELEPDLGQGGPGPGQRAAVGPVVHERVHVVGGPAHRHPGPTAVDCDHEATHKCEVLRDPGAGYVDDRPPCGEKVVSPHINGQFKASHAFLSSVRARRPPLRSLVSVLTARSAAMTAAGIVSPSYVIGSVLS